MGEHIAGVTLSPQVTGLPSFFEIAQNVALVIEVNEVSLPLAGIVSQLPTVDDFLFCESRVNYTPVHQTHETVGDRKLRIQGNRALKRLQSRARTLLRHGCLPRAVGS